MFSSVSNITHTASGLTTSNPSGHLHDDDHHERPTCAYNDINGQNYNMGLHVGAVFVILLASTASAVFPILAARFPKLRIPHVFFFLARHFGTGVIMATAFVHLLSGAYLALGDECLGAFWTEVYDPMPGAITMGAFIAAILIEMAFHPSGHGGHHQLATTHPKPTGSPQGHAPSSNLPAQGRSDSMGHEILPQDQSPLEASAETGLVGQVILTPEQKRKKDRIQCIMLEVGILFHSIFIGMALSVAIGNDFVVLLVAVVFHQTFEGLALGARISAIEWSHGSRQPWLMVLAYGCTTPIGQAIGLATHTLYSPDSEIGLILVGTMNAISAGFLLASLIDLLSEDLLSDTSWNQLHGRRRVMACLLIFVGSFSMSLVGAWA